MNLKTKETEDTLARSKRDQEKECIPQTEWVQPPSDAYGIYILFNLEAAYDEGHAILALGPIGGNLETYSYYRHSSKVIAPGIMACLMEPMTFKQIIDDSGWILHGQKGNYWNEHMNAALAMWTNLDSYARVREAAEKRKADNGMYDLVTNNCITFVEEALAAGGIKLLKRDDDQTHTFIPKDAFRKIRDVEGAYKLDAWKYWFEITDPPKNGFRSIMDEPGQDKPLE